MITSDRIRQVGIDAMISTPVGIVVGVVLAWVTEMSPWHVLVCGILVAIAIYGIRLGPRVDRGIRNRSDERFILGTMSSVPAATAEDAIWETWITTMRSRLRGRGWRRKAEALEEEMRRETGTGRREVAESFIQGLAQEIRQSGRPE